MSKYLDKWPALTSDSVQLDTLIHNMGMGQNIQLQDVCDFETDLFGNILALIVLFGESEDEERKKATEEETRDYRDIHGMRRFVEQSVDNACGMFAIINGILNSSAHKDIGKLYLPLSYSCLVCGSH